MGWRFDIWSIRKYYLYLRKHAGLWKPDAFGLHNHAHDIAIKKRFVGKYTLMDAKTFISELSGRLGRDADDISAVVTALGRTVAGCVKEGDMVSMPGFSTFEPKKRMEREAVHPSSGKRILIPPKLTMVFKPSTLLKQKIRNL